MNTEKRIKINFYTNIPSFYQENFFTTLSNLADVNVFYENDLPTDRKELGWTSSLDKYNYVFEKELNFKKKIFLERDSFHVISGFPGGVKNFLRVFFFKEKKKLFFQSEFPSNFKKFSIFNFGSIVFAKYVNFHRINLLGIGKKIRDYWKSIGVDEELIYPWAYFVDKNKNGEGNIERSNKSPILFVGQIINRKGLDILLNAFKIASERIENELWIVGVGEQYDEIMRMSKSLELNNRVKFLGAVSSSKIQSIIGQASVLVLPSRYDGWGVVTNEAIINDTPLIVSNTCGSEEFVGNLKTGLVFQNEDTKDLSDKFITLLAKKQNWSGTVENCRNNQRLITTQSASNYLTSLIFHLKNDRITQRPISPWISKIPS